MKTKIFVVLALVASIAMFSSGAFAYFTTIRNTQTGTVTAGTLDIQLASTEGSIENPIAPADSAFGNSTVVPWNFDNLAPGDSKSGCLWVKNTGSLGTIRIYWLFNQLTAAGGKNNVNLANRLEIVKMFNTGPQVGTWPIDLMNGQYPGDWDTNHNGKIDLTDLVNWDWQNDVDPFLLAHGQTGAYCMTVKMMNGAELVDNDYQGASLTYNIDVKAFNPAP
jgi:hypothetical protein